MDAGKQCIIYLVLYAVALCVSAVFLLPYHFGILIWLLLSVIGLFFLIRWHSKNIAYICSNCSHVFTISTTEDFMSFHMFDKKQLRCPKCRHYSWCKGVGAKDVLNGSEQ